MQIRAATEADVPAIAALVLARASQEAPWNSFIPGGARKDPNFVQHAEALTRSYVEASEDAWVVRVVELSAAEAEHNKPVVVAVGVWDTNAASNKAHEHPNKAAAYVTTKTDNWSPSSENQKLNALSDAMLQGRQRYFAAEGPHIYLRILATHPEHQGHGYAKALCKWGIDLAYKKHAAVCLETGSRGYVLLSGMGFCDLGAVVVPAGKGYDEQILKALRMDVAKMDTEHPTLMTSLWKYITT
ncbi:hypothetical protein K4F52_004513 [Lecanicillium sp. MT-2017a]|nr:hypothetical protein K4F52_004513 [Lecanicillium sp. MT-2017a]